MCRTMASDLIGAKPLPKRMMIYCQRNSIEKTCYEIWTKAQNLSKHVYNCLQNVDYFTQPAICWSTGPNDIMWWHTSVLISVQAPVCGLTVPSHYLNQCCVGIIGIRLSENSKVKSSYEIEFNASASSNKSRLSYWQNTQQSIRNTQ